MHLLTSISLATGIASRTPGGWSVLADRRRRSRDDRSAILVPPSGHRRFSRLDVDQERLELRRLDVGVADEGGQRVGAEALARSTGEAPVQGNADDVHGLAVAGHRLDALGHHRLGLDVAAVARDPHPAAARNSLLRGELLGNLDEEL